MLFTVALLCICFRGYGLFTGKVGFFPEAHGKNDISVLLTALLGNTLATAGCGYAVMLALPKLSAAARALCEGKLTQTFPQALIRAVFCGILMYLAVSIYRDKKSIAGTLFCVPVFILSGFEHSIADMFYFALSGIVSGKAFLYLMTIVLGNAVGGMLLPLISMLGEKEKQHG